MPDNVKEEAYLNMGFSYFNRPHIFTTDRNTVTLPAGLEYGINDKRYSLKSDVTIDLNNIIPVKDRIGRNVYIYAIYNEEGITQFEFSLDKPSPEGYTTENSRKLGGFHCLDMDVGRFPGHPLSGYVKGDIIPASCWDLYHRPSCDEPDSMVYVEALKAWVDIYKSTWPAVKFQTSDKELDEAITRLVDYCQSKEGEGHAGCR